MSKILTIIVPTYNMEWLLGRCLQSLVLHGNENLQRQTEVLVIIDGATDSSKKIALDYQNNYPDSFRVIEKENGNYGSCVNRGLQEAQGKYVKILDADDSFDSEWYAQYLTKLLTLEADLIVSSGSFVDVENQKWGDWRFEYETDRMYEVEDLRPLWIHYITYKTVILKEINYRQTEGISYTDEEWCFYPILAVHNFYSLSMPLYRYTVGREGQTMDPCKWIKSADQEVKVTMGLLHFIETNDYWKKSRVSAYLQQKLIERISSFYQKMLIDYGLYDNENLLSLEDYLQKHNPEVYNQLSDVVASSKRITFHYIRYWRKHHPLTSLFNKFQLYKGWLFLRGWLQRPFAEHLPTFM